MLVHATVMVLLALSRRQMVMRMVFLGMTKRMRKMVLRKMMLRKVLLSMAMRMQNMLLRRVLLGMAMGQMMRKVMRESGELVGSCVMTTMVRPFQCTNRILQNHTFRLYNIAQHLMLLLASKHRLLRNVTFRILSILGLTSQLDGATSFCAHAKNTCCENK